MAREIICGIYKITNKVNGKCYIGQSEDIYRRWGHHKSKLERNKHRNIYLQSAYNKYGEENFEYSILEVCDDIEKLDELEIYYIKKFNTLKMNKDSQGYNLTAGGEGTRGLNGGMSSKARKVVCDGIVYGCIKDCAEHYKVSSATMRGWLSTTYPMPIEFYNMNLRYYGDDETVYEHKDYVICDGKYYEDSTKFCNEFGLPKTTVNNWLLHRHKMPMEWYVLGLRYLSEPMNTYEYSINEYEGKSKRVICNNIIYESITDFSKEYNVDIRNVSSWLHGKVPMPPKYYNMGLRFVDYEYPIRVQTGKYSKKKILCNNKIYNTIKECAKEIGVSPVTTSRWFKKEQVPSGKFEGLNIEYYKGEGEI